MYSLAATNQRAYEALVDGVEYNPFDWQVFCAGEAVENYSFVLYGPEPGLSSGSLPSGRRASGYVVYEVAGSNPAGGASPEADRGAEYCRRRID